MTQPIMYVFIKSLYLFIKDPSGRGEIGKHKGLKTATLTGYVTWVTANLLNNNKNLEDKTSVAIGNRSDDLCLCRDITPTKTIMKKQKNWTHQEAIKAGKVFRKHEVPCRVYQSQSWNDDDSYLVVYVEKDGKNYRGGSDNAYKECASLGIEAMYRYINQSQ